MVKERDFEPEKYQNKCKKHPTLVLCLIAIFRLEMGQNQLSLLKNQIKSTRDSTGFWVTIVDLEPFLARY